jgi:hypothetical protein
MKYEWLRDCTHEEVVGVGDRTTDSEELHQVMELAVDVAAYLDIISNGSVRER